MTSETNDPIVDEIRVIRARYAARFDYDVDAMVDYVQALQNVIDRSPRRLKVATRVHETD